MINLQPTTWKVAALLLLLAGCSKKQQGRPLIEPSLSNDETLTFGLQALPQQNGAQCWLGTYPTFRKVAKFRIELGPAEASDDKGTKEFHFKFGKGTFIPEAGSDPSILLADLRTVLRAKTQPVAPSTKTKVSFTYANLGEHLSQSLGGGFAMQPTGDWVALKLFFGEGEQEAEVFVNLNSKIKQGQFSMKDPEYGDLVLQQLAKVF